MAHKEVGWSEGEAVRPHDIYACYNCELNKITPCRYLRRAKYMSNLDQWTKCPRMK
ncbi:MAG: hypothetical protein ABSA11_10210 [Candidatus Bathyarchaeia archaeon]